MKASTQSQNPIVITADDRERPSGVIESLAATSGVTVEVRRLRLGDFDVGGKLLVERKTTFDFALSVIDGRLFRQAYSLMTSERRTCLILEGPPSNIKMSREALQGALITVTMIFGQPVLRSQTPKETAWLMLTAAHQLSRSEAQNPGRKIRRKGRNRWKIQSSMLQAIPGIGPGKAKALLNSFGDIKALASQDVAEIMLVPGIGQTFAERIRWALNRPSP
ncbi:MAG: ERCC4 domain-containing protein [Acidobacteriota bacterium]